MKREGILKKDDNKTAIELIKASPKSGKNDEKKRKKQEKKEAKESLIELRLLRKQEAANRETIKEKPKLVQLTTGTKKREKLIKSKTEKNGNSGDQGKPVDRGNSHTKGPLDRRGSFDRHASSPALLWSSEGIGKIDNSEKTKDNAKKSPRKKKASWKELRVRSVTLEAVEVNTDGTSSNVNN